LAAAAVVVVIIVVIVMIELKTYVVFRSTHAPSLQKGSKDWDHFQHCVSVTFLQELKKYRNLEGCYKEVSS
jgi:hypothetical protein